MVKQAASKESLIKKWLSEYPKEHFTSDGSVVFCNVCNKAVQAEKKYRVQQHVNSGMHKTNLQKAKQTSETQSMLTQYETKPKKNQFNRDLCHAFLAADIPFFKLQEANFRSFLEKYTGMPIPSDSTIRKGYLLEQYNLQIQMIRKAIGSCNIWVGIDETTDSVGRYIVHIVVGALKPNQCSKSFLLASKQVDNANHSTMAHIVDDALKLLWPDVVHRDRVLLFLTDSAAYMKKAARALQIFYPNMLPVTCLAHALHLVAEEIRNNFTLVDDLISNVKKIFSKAPNRIALYKHMCPELVLPPKPVLTRWGTWLKAAEFYRQNYLDVKRVVEALDSKDAQSIKKVQELLADDSLCSELAHVCSSYAFIADSIVKIEEPSLSLQESLNIVREALLRVKAARGENAAKILSKFSVTLEKNVGFGELNKIALVLVENAQERLYAKLSPAQICSFTYAPVVTCDVERSFSRFKNIFRDNRQRFTPENLEMTVIVTCNSANLL